MSKPIPAALLVAALFAGISSASAGTQFWTDMSAPYDGYAPNSQDGNRTFWDYQTRHGRQ